MVQIINLSKRLGAFRHINSQATAVDNNKIPIAKKSRIVQLTWFVNCIATAGSSNSSTIIIKIKKSLFLEIIVFFEKCEYPILLVEYKFKNKFKFLSLFCIFDY